MSLPYNLEQNLPTGKVRRSRSASGTPILFVCKKDGSLRLVIDYRALNWLIITNKYALPLIGELLDKTRGGKWFTRLDLKNKFNLIRVAAGHEWKTAFRTTKELFAYTGMPFALTNAYATVQEMMDTILQGEEGGIWYMDDIRIYRGTTEAEHQAFVENVLQQRVKHELAVNETKSECHVHENIFLGHIVNVSQVQMDPG